MHHDQVAVSAVPLKGQWASRLESASWPDGADAGPVAEDAAASDGAVRTRIASVTGLGMEIISGTRIFVRERKRIVPISLREIVRFEAEDDYVALVTGARRHYLGVPLATLERSLDPTQFVRIHRSHIVNLDFVVAFHCERGGRLVVELRNGTRIAASKLHSRALRHLAL